MTDLEFEILEHLYKANQHTLLRSDLTSKFTGRVIDADAALDQLIKNHLVKQQTGSFFVTLKKPEGINAYNRECKRREDSTKSRKREWIFAIIGALIAGAIGFLFDLLSFLLFG